jgi:hypothetical protein
LAEPAPVLLALEDLHWADPSTRELVAFLHQTLRVGRVLVVASYRSDELHAAIRCGRGWLSWAADRGGAAGARPPEPG